MLSKPLRLAAAFLVSIILYLTFVQRDFNTISFIPITNPLSHHPSLVKDAHKLPNADSFLPHFKAVISLPGLSMKSAKSTCTWPDLSVLNFQYVDDDWVVNDRNDSELESRRKDWHAFIENDLIPYEQYKDRFEGRGIVIVAGNERTMKRVKVVLRALAKLGSKISIELHYWKDELTLEVREEVTTMWSPYGKIYFNDLSSPLNIIKPTFNFFLANFQFKTAAVLNSRFEEVLLLDSDNIPLVAPEELFDSELYQTYGTIFWPDIARTRPNNPMWAITNTECRMNEYEQESGQLFVDKQRFWYHLQLAAWFNDNRTVEEGFNYYNHFLLGDKDMFRFAWHALKTDYGFPSKWLKSVGFHAGGHYCGHSFAQHGPDGLVAFLHGGLLKTIPEEVMRWLKVQGGVWQVYKSEGSPSIRWDGGWYYPKEGKIWSCTEFAGVEERGLDEIVMGFEGFFEEIGGYWMLDEW